MRRHVVGVGKLARRPSVRRPLKEVVEHLVERRYALLEHAVDELLGRGDDFRVVCLEQLLALGRHAVLDADFELVSLCRRECRERDAGVAAGEFDERVLAGAYLAALFRLLDDFKGDAVFVRACGVKVLQLARNPAFQPERRLKAVEFDNRRVPDQLRDRIVNLCHFFVLAKNKSLTGSAVTGRCPRMSAAERARSCSRLPCP